METINYLHTTPAGERLYSTKDQAEGINFKNKMDGKFFTIIYQGSWLYLIYV